MTRKTRRFFARSLKAGGLAVDFINRGGTPYDELAPLYCTLRQRRAAYLDAVENIIIGRLAACTESLLDMGAGDGCRAMRIAQAKSIGRVVLAEPSESMRKLCATHSDSRTEIWDFRAEELPISDDRFAVITCLWNVLGHVEGRENRIEALKRMGNLLREDGLLFIDVQNRYNAASYGYLRTLARLVFDIAAPHPSNGDAQVSWRIGSRQIRSYVHFFRPAEIGEDLATAGFVIKRKFAVDYQTGEVRKTNLAGQLLFEAAKA